MDATTSFLQSMPFDELKRQSLEDYTIAVLSRECSLLGRKEVLTGKAKFGIFGDGKEVPQLAMARAFRKGDFRSGYYRDQTFMLAIGEYTPKQFFAGIYADNDITHEPHSGGRQMGGHFSHIVLMSKETGKDWWINIIQPAMCLVLLDRFLTWWGSLRLPRCIVPFL